MSNPKNKRRPRAYGHLSPHDGRFRGRYQLDALYDNKTDTYLLVPRVEERYPGEFGVCCFSGNMMDRVRSPITVGEFYQILTKRAGDGRYEILSPAMLDHLYDAFETYCFEEPIEENHSSIREHGLAVNNFIDFCVDCQRCREREINLSAEHDECFVPLKTGEGNAYCDRQQQLLCASIWAVRTLVREALGDRSSERPIS